MINSRKIEDLCDPARERVQQFLDSCKALGIDVILTSTYRDYESQNALYAQGRTAPGKIVTNAKGGESWHNFRCAVDVCPIVNGKRDWDGSHPVWQELGHQGRLAGLEWAGEWKGSLRESAHFQYTGGLTLAQLRDGAVIK